MNIWLAFFTGLTAGGISCMAVQGGLLAGLLANQKSTDSGVRSTIFFLVSKILAYTFLGGLLGLFGSFFQLSLRAQIWFQVIAAILMIGMAANMLNIHPAFRYFVIQPPKWAGKLLRRQSAPVLLGLFTVFVPCGVTQAMEVSAIASGSWFAGALIMFAFTLGTSPLFLALGILAKRLSVSFQKNFQKVAGVLVLLIALTSINGALVLAGSNYSLDKWTWAFKQSFLTKSVDLVQQEVNIKVTGSGYTPSKLAAKSGERLTLNLQTENNYSCTSVFTIPQLGISKQLPVTGDTEISFIPQKPGLLTFSCGMGMFAGTIEVI